MGDESQCVVGDRNNSSECLDHPRRKTSQAVQEKTRTVTLWSSPQAVLDTICATSGLQCVRQPHKDLETELIEIFFFVFEVKEMCRAPTSIFPALNDIFARPRHIGTTIVVYMHDCCARPQTWNSSVRTISAQVCSQQSIWAVTRHVEWPKMFARKPPQRLSRQRLFRQRYHLQHKDTTPSAH